MTGRSEAAGLAARKRPDVSASLLEAVASFRSLPMEFRLSARMLGSRSGALVSLDPFVETIQWSDEPDESESGSGGVTSSGSVTLRAPDPLDPASLPVGNASTLVLFVSVGGRSYQLWSMRTSDPEWDDVAGTLTVSIGDQMEALKRSKIDVVLRAGDRGRRYRTGEIVEAVLGQINVRAGSVIRGSKEASVKRVVRRNTRAYDVILDQLIRETHVRSGLRLLWRFNNGAFEVTPFRVNPLLYAVQDALTAAIWKERWRGGNGAYPYTQIEGHARLGKGKHAKVLKSFYPRKRPSADERELMRRYGKRVKRRNYPPVDSQSELDEHVKRTYAYFTTPVRAADVTVTPGVPFMRMGDMVTLDVPAHGYEGPQSLVLVESVTHTIQEGACSSDVTVSQKNPYRQYKKDRERAARDAARKKRKRKGS